MARFAKPAKGLAFIILYAIITTMRNAFPFPVAVILAWLCIASAQAESSQIPAAFTGTAVPRITATTSLQDATPKKRSRGSRLPGIRGSNALMPTDNADTPPDNYLWLENLGSEESLAWVRARNAATGGELEASPHFKELRAALLAIANASDRVPTITQMGGYYYNFWADETHPRGVLRRVSAGDADKPEPPWEIVLDVSAFAATENENWVLEGANPFMADDSALAADRMLVALSRGGADSVVMREFDLNTKTFVRPEDGGFVIPEGKNSVDWRDRDSLFVAIDSGSDTLTYSGIPCVLKKWRRGTPLSEAETLYAGMRVEAGVQAYKNDGHEFIIRHIDRVVGTSKKYVLIDGTPRQLDMPDGAQFWCLGGQIILRLPRRWSGWDFSRGKSFSYAAESIVAANFDTFMAGDRDFTTLLVGDARKPSGAMSFATKNHFVTSQLDDLRLKIHAWHFDKTNETWNPVHVPAPEYGTTTIRALAGRASDEVVISTSDFVRAPTLTRFVLGQAEGRVLTRLSARFDGAGMEMRRCDATSKDGTLIPYFLVTPKNFRADGGTPTILHGYGGFGRVTLPGYSPLPGKCWLERGGAFVLACIRGGGEFGAAWAEAGKRENRQNAYDDFAAVAQDLIARKITSPERLGIMGASNGGLLVSVAFTQNPGFYRAVVSRSPILDMRRFPRLFNGAIYASEYGNPDIRDNWGFLKKYSPYHNVKPASEIKYPHVLFTASANDDRVHPAHARKMAALMQAQGHDVLYYESVEGGHSSGTTANEVSYMEALVYAFFSQELGLAAPARP